MLGSVRSVGARNELQIVNFSQGIEVNRHSAEWCLEGIVFGRSNAAHGEIMCRPNQHDARDRVPIILKPLQMLLQRRDRNRRSQRAARSMLWASPSAR